MLTRTVHLKLRPPPSHPSATGTRRRDEATRSLAPRWVTATAWTAVLAALPTVMWRVLVGVGLDLGTPETWRAEEHLPGTGTAYVLMLSALELLAVVLTLRLARPGADRVPSWSPIRAGRRLPATAVCLVAGCGLVALAIVCVLSVVNWSAVDPFAGDHTSAASWLCTDCYLSALLWPPALLITLIGYVIGRRRERRAW